MVYEVHLLSVQVTPKYPSLHMQTKVSIFTSTQVAPLSHGELRHASHGTEIKKN